MGRFLLQVGITSLRVKIWNIIPQIPTYKHIVDIFILLPLYWLRSVLQKVADNGIQHPHFYSPCLGCKYSMRKRTRSTTVPFYVLQNLLVLCSYFKWDLQNAQCSLMSRCSKYWHGLPWQCHLERRAARYSGRPSLHWPLTSVSLAEGKSCPRDPGHKLARRFPFSKRRRFHSTRVNAIYFLLTCSYPFRISPKPVKKCRM